MKKLSISFLLILTATFAFISASAQTQKSASQKTSIKSGAIQKQPAPDKNASAVSSDKKEEPAINDAVINVNDQQQYIEQKKKDKEQKDTEKRTDAPK